MTAEDKRNAALGRNFAAQRQIELTHFFSIGTDAGIEWFAFGYRSRISGSFRTGVVAYECGRFGVENCAMRQAS